MTDSEFEMLQDLLSRPEVTLFAKLENNDVLPFYAYPSAAYIRRERPDNPGTYENYAACVRIELFPRASMTVDQLNERCKKLLETWEKMK